MSSHEVIGWQGEAFSMASSMETMGTKNFKLSGFLDLHVTTQKCKRKKKEHGIHKDLFLEKLLSTMSMMIFVTMASLWEEISATFRNSHILSIKRTYRCPEARGLIKAKEVSSPAQPSQHRLHSESQWDYTGSRLCLSSHWRNSSHWLSICLVHVASRQKIFSQAGSEEDRGIKRKKKIQERETESFCIGRGWRWDL